LKAQACATDFRVIQEHCKCQACQRGITWSRLHFMYKTGNPVAVQLLTQHNLAYMMQLVRDMRASILGNRYAIAFVKNMRMKQYPAGWWMHWMKLEFRCMSDRFTVLVLRLRMQQIIYSLWKLMICRLM
jgi:hypothetical protein